MNMRHWLRLAYPALALLIASCGGGGGSSAGGATVPVIAASPAGPAPQGKMVIAIPNAPSSQSKVTKGISPAASSISIAVTGITSPQVADISATSPNCTANTAGRTCAIPVQAAVGNDTFTITIFDGPNATGNQLGTGSATSNVVPGAPFQVSITLNGIIASLQFVVNRNSGTGGGSGSGSGSGTGNSSVGPPVGQAGSVIGTVAALDASGNYIVGPYNSTVTITSSNPSISVSPASLTGSGPVTFSYDGVATNPVTLTATAGTITGTFTVTPSTNIIYYPTPTINPAFIFTGPDGKYYMDEFGPEQFNSGQLFGTGPGKIARFDPVTKTFAGEVTVGNTPLGIAWAPDGSIFEANARDFPGTIGHVTGFASYSPTAIPSYSGFPRALVLGPDGNMWFIEQRGSGPPFLHANIGKFSPATPASITEYPLPAGSRAQWLTVGPDNNFYVTDSGNGAVDQVTTSGAVTAFPIPGATPGALNVFPRFITSASDGNLYLSDLGSSNSTGSPVSNGNVWRLTTAGAFTKINMPTPNAAGPDTIIPGPSGSLFFSDLQNSAVGQVTTAGVVTEWPVNQNCASTAGAAPDGMVYAADGSIWYTSGICTVPPAPPTPSLLAHFIFAAGWTVFPLDNTIALSPVGVGQQQLLGIAESGDSSPFTAVSSNPSVVSVSSSGLSSHNFLLTAVSNGTATITITDSHSNTVTKNVTVTSATGTIQSTQRRPQ